MEFRTELSVKNASWDIDLKDPILTIGSCFSESIGTRFIQNKFKVSANPFGTTYNPLSIHKLLNYAAYQEAPAGHTFVEHEGVWSNFDFHSEFSAPGRNELQNRINQAIGVVHYFIKECKVLILTYGTSWIFERAETGEDVANCHKLQASLFTKRLASVEEITKSFQQTLSFLKTINPSLRVILTISPVRHVKDSLPLNSVSKSILRTTCHQICEGYEGVEYFPSYEIMVDDLRDYRFYKDDLIHPTTAAEDYIWEKFQSVYFTTETHHFIKEWEEIRKILAHRPFHPESKAHQNFLKKTLIRLEELKSMIPVDEEIGIIQSQMLH